MPPYSESPSAHPESKEQERLTRLEGGGAGGRADGLLGLQTTVSWESQRRPMKTFPPAGFSDLLPSATGALTAVERALDLESKGSSESSPGSAADLLG